MSMRYLRFLSVTVLLGSLTSCMRDDAGMVLIDGRFVSHTPQVESQLAAQRLSRLVEKATGGPAHVDIHPDPQWELYAEERYSWASVQVVLHLPAGTHDARRLTDIVRDDLNLQVRRRDDVTVSLGDPLPQGATGSVPPITTYVIQAGDTLAQITALHYGSTTPWKRIVEANPGLDPAHLPVGTTITIPPATIPPAP